MSRIDQDGVQLAVQALGAIKLPNPNPRVDPTVRIVPLMHWRGLARLLSEPDQSGWGAGVLVGGTKLPSLRRSVHPIVQIVQGAHWPGCLILATDRGVEQVAVPGLYESGKLMFRFLSVDMIVEEDQLRSQIIDLLPLRQCCRRVYGRHYVVSPRR